MAHGCMGKHGDVVLLRFGGVCCFRASLPCVTHPCPTSAFLGGNAPGPAWHQRFNPVSPSQVPDHARLLQRERGQAGTHICARSWRIFYLFLRAKRWVPSFCTLHLAWSLTFCHCRHQKDLGTRLLIETFQGLPRPVGCDQGILQMPRLAMKALEFPNQQPASVMPAVCRRYLHKGHDRVISDYPPVCVCVRVLMVCMCSQKLHGSLSKHSLLNCPCN